MWPSSKPETARERLKSMLETETRAAATTQETMVTTVMAIIEREIGGTIPREGPVPGLLKVIRQ